MNDSGLLEPGANTIRNLLVTNAKDQGQELEISKVLAEYMHRCDSGPTPNREEFLSRHPELRDQLSELLSAADWIEQLAGPRVADLGKSASNLKEDKALDDVRLADEDTLPHVSKLNQSSAHDQTISSGATTDESAEGTSARPKARRELSQPVLPCHFGDYLLERVIGRGGMGVVYMGRQENLDRQVAIKMIRSGALASEEEVQRFYAEARSAAQLDHPNIVTVYQCGEQAGHRYFSMDYVPGTDLSRLTADGPIDCKRAARYVRDVARAIQYAHDRGILHRDLKPANVLVDENDIVRITDFGLAKSIGTETGLTATGAALGTPSYMSPEQAAGRVNEHYHATDIYSLGAILFTIVTGQPPFKANTVVQTIMHVIHRPAPAARTVNPKVDEDIETIIDVCLQKSPERRYGSAQALADDLDRYLSGSPIQARPMSQMRRVWYWLLGVPIFGAVLDHRVIEPTDAHRWVQRGLISIAIMFVVAWLSMAAFNSGRNNRMPRKVRFAAGMSGGTYSRIAESLCDALGSTTKCEALLIPTDGSSENIDLLTSADAELALVQADALGAEGVEVVAPLYYEAVHVLVRRDLGIPALGDLRGRKVRIGSVKTGSHSVARLLLSSAGLSFDDIAADSLDWHSLVDDPAADAAIIVTQLGSSGMSRLLKKGDYELLPMSMPRAVQFALDEPAFHYYVVSSEDYPDCNMVETPTVVTTAFLVARVGTPDILVKTILEHLFSEEIRQSIGIVSAERAAHWQGLATWHPAAREFFASYRGSPPTK